MNSPDVSPVSTNRTFGGARRSRADFPARRWTRTLAGYALGWRWFDAFGDWGLRRLFLPASYLWATAQLADGSPERFLEALDLSHHRVNRRRLAKALALFERARVRAAAAEVEWQRAFFGEDETFVAHRVAAEAERLAAAHNYNATRRHFAFMLWRGAPPLRLVTETPEEAGALDRVALPEPMPAVEVSRSIPVPTGIDYWLRFRSPSPRLGDTVYARVHEPAGVENPPTIILGHGICVEFDHWRGLIDEALTLCESGFRVIRPEAPWHGRRTPRGSFGGERMVTRFPSGIFDAFEGAIAEWAVIADWSRRTSRGALAFGGTSLGAQMAQLAADRAGVWPERLRPDGLFLITHCGHMADAAMHGQLSHVFGSVHDIAAKGWDEAALAELLQRLDPREASPVPPGRIVTVLGKRDAVTPFRSALPLIDAWAVPADNRFIWNRAHFSVPATLMRNPRPVARFREVMQNPRGN